MADADGPSDFEEDAVILGGKSVGAARPVLAKGSANASASVSGPQAQPSDKIPCWFGCGPEFHESQMRNIGNARCKLLACRPCHNASLSLRRQCLATSDECFRAVTELRRADPEQYKKRVVAMRIRGPDDIGGSGVSDARERRATARSYLDTTTSYLKVEDQTSVRWLSRRQYIAHMKYVEGLTQAQAAARWDADKANPDIERRGNGDTLTLAVAEPARTVGTAPGFVSPLRVFCKVLRVVTL